MKRSSRLALLIVNVVLDGTVAFLLVQLLVFHLYIKLKGMTTYEFIMRNKIRSGLSSAHKPTEPDNRHNQSVQIQREVRPDIENSSPPGGVSSRKVDNDLYGTEANLKQPPISKQSFIEDSVKPLTLPNVLFFPLCQQHWDSCIVLHFWQFSVPDPFRCWRTFPAFSCRFQMLCFVC